MRGPVAQLGARFNGIEEVTGSNPVRSTILFFPRISKAASLPFRVSSKNAPATHPGSLAVVLLQFPLLDHFSHWCNPRCGVISSPSALLSVNSARNLLFRRERSNPLVQKQSPLGKLGAGFRFAQDDSQRGCLVPMAVRSTPFAKTV